MMVAERKPRVYGHNDGGPGSNTSVDLPDNQNPYGEGNGAPQIEKYPEDDTPLHAIHLLVRVTLLIF
jgi:hypothetical protein